MAVDRAIRSRTPARPFDPRLYWALTGLFCAIFVYSAVWNLVDPVGARIDTIALGFPGWTVYPLAIAKLAGVAVILRPRWRTLTGLAFAGFFYDVVLALSTHLVQGNVARASLAALAVASTVGAFWAYQQKFPASTRP